MITMRNIWIMMLGICLFGCGAGKQPLSSQLSLTWKLEKDSVEARYFKNTFCLTNNGNKSLADNWVIYFNQTPIYYQQPINAPLEIECIGSTYYKMYPTEHYQALAPGETITFTILSEGNVINVSSVPEGAMKMGKCCSRKIFRLRSDCLRPMLNGFVRRIVFPMQVEIISISRMMISVNR